MMGLDVKNYQQYENTVNIPQYTEEEIALANKKSAQDNYDWTKYDPNDKSTWNQWQRESFLAGEWAPSSGDMTGQQMQSFLNAPEGGINQFIPDISGGLGEGGLTYSASDPTTGS